MSIILGKEIFLTTPPTYSKFTGQEYSHKNLYIYQGKKDGYSWAKTRKLNHPPRLLENLWAKILGQKYSLRFSHIWPF